MIEGNSGLLTEWLDERKQQLGIFVGSVSFEPRCVTAASCVFRKYGPSTKYLFLDYAYAPDITTGRQEETLKTNRASRQQRQAENRKAIERELHGNVEFITATIKDPMLDYLREVGPFVAKLRELSAVQGNLCIDFSTFTKPMMALLLGGLIRGRSNSHLVIANTKPHTYRSPNLSMGVAQVDMLPGFNGEWNPNMDNALLAILGFEGHKLAAIIERWTFRHVVPVLGFPGFAPGLHERALLGNVEQLKRLDCLNSLQYAPVSDPIEAYRILAGIADTFSSRYNVAITPLGPKPLSLAAMLLAIERNCRLLYTFPQEYFPDYSYDTAGTSLYEISVS